MLKTFLIALDPFKLLIAAVGILFTSLGWWLISVIFFNGWTEYSAETREATVLEWSNAAVKKDEDKAKARIQAEMDYDTELRRYELMKKMAAQGGTFRTMPWMEDRGPNQFLLANEVIRGGAAERTQVSRWFVTNQVPVLIEPLLKFFSPVLTLFDPA